MTAAARGVIDGDRYLLTERQRRGRHVKGVTGLLGWVDTFAGTGLRESLADRVQAAIDEAER